MEPRYLTDEDQRYLIEFLHEMEHNFRSCAYAGRPNSTSCSLYLRAAANAERGYLAAVDGFVGARAAEVEQEGDEVIRDLFDECIRLKKELQAARETIESLKGDA